MILAGGYATRLRPLSYALPKLLFPVCGKPVLEQTIEHLASFDVDEIILAVNYLAGQLREYFGDEHRGTRIRYSLEPTPLGTGGPIALARQYLDRRASFLVVNGDILSEIDVGLMRELHEAEGALVTIALHEVEDPTRFGVAKLDDHSRIQEFIEKPKPAESTSKLINAGVYLMEPEVLDRIATGRKVIIEREVFPVLAGEGKLSGYIHSGRWFDIGNISDFRKANFALLEGKARGGSIIGDDANVAASAALANPTLVGEHARVEDGVKLGPRAIIGRRARIKRNAKIAETIVFDNTDIGDNSSIEGAVIGNSVSIGRDVVIQEGSVIAGYVRIGDNTRITQNVHIHPYKEIDHDILTPGHVV